MEATPASEILEQLKEQSNILKSPWCGEVVRTHALHAADLLLDKLLELRPVEAEA